MTSIELLLSEVNLEYKKEGSECRTNCIGCGESGGHLYIGGTGVFYCHKCGFKGNAWVLLKTLDIKPQEARALLGKYGLSSEKKQTRKKKASGKYRLSGIRPITEQELSQVCKARDIDSSSLKKFNPQIIPANHKINNNDTPLMVIPAYTPGQKEPCGYLRATLDGSDVILKNGKGERYPMLGQHGLLGLPWLMSCKPQKLLRLEGWRDGLAGIKLGYHVVVSSAGASTFKNEWLPVVKGCDIAIMMDEDAAGVGGMITLANGKQKHQEGAAVRDAKKFIGVAKSVKIARLPYSWQEKHGKDFHDFTAKDGNAREDVDERIDAAKQYESEQGERIILPDSHPHTIARAFEEYSEVHHKCNSKDGWSICVDNRYQKVEDPDEIEVYLRRFLSKVWIKSKDDLKRYGSSPSKIRNLMGELRSLGSVHLRPRQNAPQSLTGQFDPNYTIALKNGLLDWSQYPYKLHPHTPDFYTFNYLPFDWEGENDSDMWIQFLVDVTGGDVEVFELLQMFAGYCLLPHYRGKGYFLLLKGEADTGKSVYAEAKTHLYGTSNVSAVSLADFNDKHIMYDTYGKYLNISDESPESFSDKTVENTLKKYTGGTMFHYKAMYRPAFSAYPTAKLLFATNHRPRFTDTSEGIWTRMRYVEFNNVVPAEKQDKMLTKKLIDTEMPGILKWAIEGARKFIANGYKLPIPESSRIATEEYKRESCPELAFLEDNFKECDPKNSDLAVPCKVFRNCYEQWIKEQGRHPKNQDTVGQAMRKVFPPLDRRKGRQNCKLQWLYYGMAFKSDSEYIMEGF